jgi:hypothetical protein
LLDREKKTKIDDQLIAKHICHRCTQGAGVGGGVLDESPPWQIFKKLSNKNAIKVKPGSKKI